MRQALHKSLPAFSPYVPVGALPVLAFLLLSVTFALAFYFSTSARSPCRHSQLSHFFHSLPKGTARESTVAMLASVLGGVGTVAMFCAVGVYV